MGRFRAKEGKIAVEASSNFKLNKRSGLEGSTDVVFFDLLWTDVAEYKPHVLIFLFFKYFNFLNDEYTLHEIKHLEAGRLVYQITLVDLTEISKTLTELDCRDWN